MSLSMWKSTIFCRGCRVEVHIVRAAQVDELAYAPSIVDANILHFAARSGSKAMFEAVFDMLEEDKVLAMCNIQHV